MKKSKLKLMLFVTGNENFVRYQPVDFVHDWQATGDKDLTDLGEHAGILILKYSDFLSILTR